MNKAFRSTATPDAVPIGWVDRAPAVVQPYLRLMRADRPIGTWLLVIPCWWGLLLAGAEGHGGWNSLRLAVWFAVGAFAMRGAGCVYNDIVDRDIDAKVERTALRPLPSGQVSLRAAWGLLIGLCLLGLLVLFQLNRFAALVALASLALVAIYPFMKRITYWPQAWLGLTFNWGVLVGYAAATAELSMSAVLLYAAAIFWTLGYDTIYAHQDAEDDAMIGVKSTALKFGATSHRWVAGFYTAVIILFVCAGWAGGAPLIYYIALSPAALHLAWQVRTLDITDAHNCLIRFKANRETGLLLGFALAAAVMTGLI